MAIQVGSKVTCSATHTYDGSTSLASVVRTNTYDVIEVRGDRVVIGIGSAVTAAVNMNTLTEVGGSSPTPPVEEIPIAEEPAESPIETSDTTINTEGFDEALTALMSSSGGDEILHYTMNLLGVPHQYTQYCDYRTYSISGRSPENLIGRKFIENIFLEAPVMSVIPGKPIYLPAAKNKKGLSHALISAGNGNVSGLLTLIDQEKLHEKLRYYDFQQDYWNYMDYVNVLCSVAASFLELENYTLPSPSGPQPIIGYQWQNYRWNADSYTSAVSNTMGAVSAAANNIIDKITTWGTEAVNAIQDQGLKGGITSLKDMFESSNETNEDMIDALESVLTTSNFVQFYIDPKGGFNDSGTNEVTDSEIMGALRTGEGYANELAFIANSAGLDMTDLQNLVGGGMQELSSKLANGNAISGVMSRLMSSGSNIIKGEKMVFPRIYQRSTYTKSYSVQIDLRSPYGNRLSYFINVLVPLFHLLALAIPKQGTANSYSSPFLIRAYYPGVWSCNLGIVTSIQVDKDPDGDSFTVDGYPSHMKVTLNIDDLYSDLSITAPRDVVLFLGNSSLIEYLSVSCGVNLITPRLDDKTKIITSSVKTAMSAIPGAVENAVWGGLENLIMSITGV